MSAPTLTTFMTQSYDQRRRYFSAHCCLIAVSVSVYVGGPVWSGTIRADVDDGEYTSLGADPRYASVGFLRWVEDGSPKTASGTLVDSQWVLAAAHSIDGAAPDSVSFEIGDDVYDAESWFSHPDWANSELPESSRLLTGTDIGLIRLALPVDDVPPARLYVGIEELGSTTTVVGYGRTGTGLTGAIDLDSKKRAGENVVDLIVGPNDGILAIDFDNPICESSPDSPICGNVLSTEEGENSFGSAIPRPQEFLPFLGDSGGGAFLNVDGATQLAAIVSFIGDGGDGTVDGDYGDTTGLTRVSVHADWIESHVWPPIVGDFNHDKTLTSADLDLLTAHILDDRPYDATFDINNDDRVGADDRRHWVTELKEAVFGDANFDAAVDAKDLNAVALAWRQPDRTWARGDFDGSGFVDAGDLNLLGLSWHQSAVASPIPEVITPKLLLVLLAACGWIAVRPTKTAVWGSCSIGARHRNHDRTCRNG